MGWGGGGVDGSEWRADTVLFILWVLSGEEDTGVGVETAGWGQGFVVGCLGGDGGLLPWLSSN